MKLAVMTLSFRDYPIDKSFEVAHNFGFDGVEIWGGRPSTYVYDMDEAACDHILQLKDKYNLEVPMYTPEALGYPYNMASWNMKEVESTRDYLLKAIDVAKAIGAPRVQITAGKHGFQASRKEALKHVDYVVKSLCDKAEQVGDMTIIMEPLTTMESNTMAYLEDIIDLMDRIQSPCLKTMIDTVTPMVNGESFSDYFLKVGDKIDHVHFIDSNGGDPTHMPVGHGIIPMKELVELLKRNGYDGYLSCELVGMAREAELSLAREAKTIRALLED